MTKCYICKQKNDTTGKTCSRKCADIYLEMTYSDLATKERRRGKYCIKLSFNPNIDILKVKTC